MGDTTIANLRDHVRGQVIALNDDGYGEARAVHDGMIDRHPRAVVRCADVTDVRAVAHAAGEEGLDLAVRGGGHSVPGSGTGDDALVADLSAMTGAHGAGSNRGAPAARPTGGSNYDRLAAIKETYDPNNLFHLNQNIMPTTS